MGLGTDDDGKTKVGKLTSERLGVLDTARVVERENTNDVSGSESDTGSLDERDNTVLGSDKGQVHLHDLDLGNSLASLDVVTRVDEEADELTGRGRADLGRVVLLLDEAGLGVDHETGHADLLTPVDGVRLTRKADKQTAVSKRSELNEGSATVEVENPA